MSASGNDPIDPLTAADEADLLDWDAEKYRQLLEEAVMSDLALGIDVGPPAFGWRRSIGTSESLASLNRPCLRRSVTAIGSPRIRRRGPRLDDAMARLAGTVDLARV